jgi:phage N-6-adenine-methyltransferase
MGSLDHVSSTKFQAYRTPRKLGQNLCVEYDLILDVAADEKNALCPVFYEENPLGGGLVNSWTRPAWCNPPYNDIPSWLNKGHEEVYVEGNCPRAVFLLPFAAGVSWFTRAVTHYEVFLFDDRIKFDVPPYAECPAEFRDKLYKASKSCRDCGGSGLRYKHCSLWSGEYVPCPCERKPVRSPGGGNALIVMEPGGLVGVTGLRSSETGTLLMDFITGEFYGEIDA